MKYFMLAFAFFFQMNAFSQVRFETRVQETPIGVNEPFRVEYIMEQAQDISSFQEPVFKQLEIVQGPMQGTSQSIINNKVSSYVFVSYLLLAKKEGKITIPGATAVINGRKMTSKSVVVVVAGNSAYRPPARVNPSGSSYPPREELPENMLLRAGENPADKIKNNIFLVADFNKKEVYVGEPILSDFKLYTALKSESKINQRPSLNGFSVYDMVRPEAVRPQEITYRGRPFQSYTIRKSQLFPLQEGQFTIEPMEVENEILFYQKLNNAPSDPLDDFFGGGSGSLQPVRQRIILKTDPVAIRVKPLPEESKPANFTGAVGRFTIDAKVLPSSGGMLQAGEAAKLLVTISGAGNLPLINSPSVSWPKGVENYKPTVREDFNVEEVPISGEKIFEYVFIPTDAGMISIPPISFSFFDPKERKYFDLQSKSISMEVAAGEKKGAAKEEALLLQPNEPAFSSSLVRILVIVATALLGLILISYLVSRRKKTSNAVDPTLTALTDQLEKGYDSSSFEATQVKSKETVLEQGAVFMNALKEASERGADQEFYTALHELIWNGIGNSLGLQIAQGRGKLLAAVKQKDNGEWAGRQLEQLFLLADQHLYAPEISSEPLTVPLAIAQDLYQWWIQQSTS